MYHVRYYDQAIHPDHFKGKGVLGHIIIALNWLRWRLEVRVQRLTLSWLAKGNSLPDDRLKALKEMFSLDDKAEVLQKKINSPLRQREEGPAPYRSDRHLASFSSQIEESVKLEKPLRPVSMDNLIGQYAFDGRSKRYARGLRYSAVDPNGDFEPLETPIGTDNQPIAVGSEKRSRGAATGAVSS